MHGPSLLALTLGGPLNVVMAVSGTLMFKSVTKAHAWLMFS